MCQDNTTPVSTYKCLFFFVGFISTNNYKNKVMERRGVEANDAIALQPVEAPGTVYQQTVKSIMCQLYSN